MNVKIENYLNKQNFSLKGIMKKILIFLFLFSPSIQYCADFYRRCIDRCNKRFGSEMENLQASKNGWWDGYMGEPKYDAEKIKEKNLTILARFAQCLSNCSAKKEETTEDKEN